MEQVFLKLLNTSITAGWFILAVVLLRLLLKKAPKSIFRILWILVGIRLICPISPESVFSLIPSAQTVSTEILYTENPEIRSGINSLNQLVNPVISESLAPETGASVNPMQVIVYISSILWMIGMIVIVLYGCISEIHLRRRVSQAVLLRDNLWQSEAVTSPFVLGLLRPRIYLPFHLNEDNAVHVIAHEQAHIKRHDHWIKPAAFLLLAIYWFNPLLWLAYSLLCRDIELACDEYVIKEFDLGNRKAYSEALLACSIPHRSIAACPLAFGEVGVKQRVKNILNYKKPALWIIIAAAAVCIAAAVCFLTNPKKSEPDFASIPNTTYVFDECIYMNLLSSFFPFNGTGQEYCFGEDSFSIVSEETGAETFSISDIEWNWQPVSDSEWDDLFSFSLEIPDISSYQNKFQLKLSSQYYLFYMDGELWLANYHNAQTKMWSIYVLKEK